VAYAGQYEALKRILGIGPDRMYAYTKAMCDRLKKELPGLGYKLITPLDAESSIVVVQAKNLKNTQERLQKAGIQVTSAGPNRVRISPALYNNMEDIDRLLAALS
jgi:selenocysteine lyase/cysteine desulfurase